MITKILLTNIYLIVYLYILSYNLYKYEKNIKYSYKYYNSFN